MEGNIEEVFDFVHMGSHHINGLLSCHLFISKTLDAPAVVGSLDIQGGSYENYYTGTQLQKISARVTELAVRQFEAEVLKTRSLQFGIQQQIVETENKINFLLARYPQEIKRDKSNFMDLLPSEVNSGIPSQLLANRPDIKQAELELTAAKLDVKVARAEFYPSLGISAGIGFQAFKPS